MGYKLAGFDVIGCNEIDPRMMEVYKANHHPKYSYCEPIQEFKKRKDLPAELYQLDVLDGSPPCSSFSVAGARERDWGKKKVFREGQAEQVLDTLFFDFIDLARELQPKVVIAENVKGLLLGNAIDYVRRIYAAFDEAGYYCQHVLLNAKNMGVPQKRERVFFLCLRKDIAKPFLCQRNLFEKIPQIDMEFNEDPILWRDINTHKNERPLSKSKYDLWKLRENGDIDLSLSCERVGQNPNKFFNCKYIYEEKVANTIAGKDYCIVFDEGRYRNTEETIHCSTFPEDYTFGKCKPEYICGMSVPPVMMAQIASQVYEQWIKFSK